jgi:hypothetical protein
MGITTFFETSRNQLTAARCGHFTVGTILATNAVKLNTTIVSKGIAQIEYV